MNTAIQQMALFEDDYLIRTYGRIANSTDIALTELIANSWDSGALNVNINIPDKMGEDISVEDDGVGISRQEFLNIWLKLGYNRLKHQGDKVKFPDDVKATPRKAYGRNGIGRHSLLCFNNVYTVETWRNGMASKFTISTSSGLQPIKIINEQSYPKQGHGTKLTVAIIKNLPNIEDMLDILSARFLSDPQFAITINGNSLKLSEHKNLIKQDIITVNSDTKIEVIVIDSSKTARTAAQHGITFWIGGRRVGDPSWTIGKYAVADGRRKIARRYTIVVRSDDLYDEVLPDWTGFRTTNLMEQVYMVLIEYIKCLTKEIYSDEIDDTRMTALRENISGLKSISNRIVAQKEIADFIIEITDKKPDISQDILNVAVEAVINLEKTRSGASLLQKLSLMTSEEIGALEKLLDEWSVVDILNVIDEIDNRLLTINAIERLCSDKSVDELHTLHPIVTQARWLFGPEYESVSFTFNTSLNRAMEELFDIKVNKDEFLNGRRRPDLIILPQSTISTVCTEEYNIDSCLNEINKILIIELKKGGFKINRNELQQAQNYVSDLLRSSFVSSSTTIHAYVVGDKIDEKTDRNVKIGERDNGKVTVTTYAQLVDTASRRLFGLKRILSEHYEDLDNENIVKRVLIEPQQISFNNK